MPTPALISLESVELAFGHHSLLNHVDFSITRGERIGLIGRNGTGKSSMLRLLAGLEQPDDGRVVRMGGLRVQMVEQEPRFAPGATVIEAVCEGDAEDEDWQRPVRAHRLLDRLGLNPEGVLDELSGGTRKRVALVRALVAQPDLLLLDEPTNHLDFDGIAWLAGLLRDWQNGLLLITHDRHFLDQTCNRIVELDRGKLLDFPGNFSQWQQHKADFLNAEALERGRFDKLLAQEEAWIRQGVEARRTRNEGRVRRLEQLRRDRVARREHQGKVSLNLAEGPRSGKQVIELRDVSVAFGDHVVVKDYSTLIQRGDRVGIIGPNGVGKTTLIKLMLGDLTPDSGEVRHGTNLTIAYFDQMRAQLDENAPLTDVISPGSEWVEIGGQRKHVKSYLGDFLFEPARAGSPVSSLSGGERARLLLARLFARPANVLVLDEPTNDLDIETLELLESLLQECTATVLLVSHDREFLNNVVTQTIAYEGDGHWRDYVGGFDDWLMQRGAPRAAASAGESASASPAVPGDTHAPNTAPAAALSTPATAKPKADDRANMQASSKPAGKTAESRGAKSTRLTSWEQRELDELPDAIAKLEAQQVEASAQLADSELYRKDPDAVAARQALLKRLEGELEKKFERWEALEARRAES